MDHPEANHHIVKIRQVAPCPVMIQAVHGADQIAANRAAQATIFKNHNRVIAAGIKLVVQPHLAKFIDHYNRLGEIWRFQPRID